MKRLATGRRGTGNILRKRKERDGACTRKLALATLGKGGVKSGGKMGHRRGQGRSGGQSNVDDASRRGKGGKTVLDTKKRLAVKKKGREKSVTNGRICRLGGGGTTITPAKPGRKGK